MFSTHSERNKDECEVNWLSIYVGLFSEDKLRANGNITFIYSPIKVYIQKGLDRVGPHFFFVSDEVSDRHSFSGALKLIVLILSAKAGGEFD